MERIPEPIEHLKSEDHLEKSVACDVSPVCSDAVQEMPVEEKIAEDDYSPHTCENTEIITINRDIKVYLTPPSGFQQENKGIIVRKKF